MTAQPPGRRTESLFDNRYRYDYIYPRGRSGETLRAYDTQDGDRAVVIKRPAPQDAPPMRAGQEISIRTERQALQRLSGHPVLTELRGSGTFRVGGHTHDYVVMDLAQGEIVEQIVLRLAEQGSYVPELETLVIIDNLLDLLAYAHDRQVIYNDVDAKHLFWDRAHYRLKVIDWGNAVFTDEPGALPTVSRATDIYQVGELLYFILTGGNRLVVEGQDGDSFFVQFGPDAERIPARLQAIVTRAVHADARRRFATIRELRHALTEYRVPLEKTRDDILSRVRKRVRATASQEELAELSESLQVALDMDPGFPTAAALIADIQHLQRQITVQADLDAIRIYLESGNWTRALALLNDLLPGVDAENEPLIQFLIAAAALLEEQRITPPPASFLSALDSLFRGEAPAAGQTLMTAGESRLNARQVQWLLAEQLAAYLPQVVLLRPHLARLRLTLADMTPTLALLDQAEAELNLRPMPGLTGLQVIYQQAGATLGRLEGTLRDSLDDRAPADADRMIAPVRRAQHAAQQVAARLEEVGQYVYGDPARAGTLLHQAEAVDPISPHFAALHDYFDEVHQAVTALAQFRPRSDGTNLKEWFGDVDDFIQPYLEDLPDQRLHAAADALRRAGDGWTTAVNYLALGRHQPTIQLLRDTAETIRPFNEQLAAWLGALANRLPDAPFAEQFSPNDALSDKLVEGWKAWDRGDGALAADFGQQAYPLATTDGERMAANRLRRLGELLDGWLADRADTGRTDHAESQVLAVMLTDEDHERRTFAEQMPDTTIYLKAMSRGIAAWMRQSSSAGWRALYFHYTLRGVLSLQEGRLDDADFWRSAAEKTYDTARTHRAFQVLDQALTARRLILNAQQALNAVSGPRDIDMARSALNAPLAGDALTGAQQAVQLAGDALRNWSDGDFYAARQALDLALEQIQRSIDLAGLQVTSFVDWLTRLRDAAADLHQTRLTIEQGAATTSEEPDRTLAEAHRHIVALSTQHLGPDHAHQVRQWNDMYQAVFDTYTTQRLTRREKLAAFDRHFTSLFIARHPAYPLFRHWQTIVEQLPLDEAEDSMIELESFTARTVDSPAYLEDDQDSAQTAAAREPRHRTDLPWNWIIVGAAALLIAFVALALLRDRGQQSNSGPTQPPRPTEILGTIPGVTAAAPAIAAQPSSTPVPATTVPPPSATPAPSQTTVTSLPGATPTEAAPPTLTPTLFITRTPAASRTPAPVAEAPTTSNDTDVLAALQAAPGSERPGSAGALVPGSDGAWTLANVDGSETIVEFPPELINALFRPGAANTLRRADVTLELISYDPAALGGGEIAFGLGAENAQGQLTIGEVQVLEQNFIGLGLSQNGQFHSSTQFPASEAEFMFSVRRTDATTLGFFVDDRSLGGSVYLFPQSEPVTLVLFVAGRDAAVRVSAFEITYRLRSEIP